MVGWVGGGSKGAGMVGWLVTLSGGDEEEKREKKRMNPDIDRRRK